MTRFKRFWRGRFLARVRHRLISLKRFSSVTTRTHAALIRGSGGRIRRSFVFTGGMPILVLTTTGRRSGKTRSTPLAYTTCGDAFVVIASNAGSEHTPGWWLNLQEQPKAEVLVDRVRYAVTARQASPTEDAAQWKLIADLNPGFDEYRRLTTRKIPVVILEPRQDTSGDRDVQRPAS